MKFFCLLDSTDNLPVLNLFRVIKLCAIKVVQWLTDITFESVNI